MGNTAFCVYPINGSGVVGNPISFYDENSEPVCFMFQGAITNSQSKVFVGGVDNTKVGCAGRPTVDRWPFPGGGYPTNGNTNNVADPTGTAVSSKPNT
jgi:hypothetical protein